ncbi:MAG: serine hydrolase, partial [Lachnospiraceae bacterium]|nr:serine hydrolase [Lachnospiraceae bacterium]
AFADGPLEFEPGTHYLYSLCHDVLGAVIEVVSGMRFGEYLQKAIYEPLGMTDTTFHPTEAQLARISALMRVNEETGELDYVGNVRSNHRIQEAYESGGGGLVSSVNDYIKLGAALANYGKAWNGYQLLKPETVELYRSCQLGPVQQADMLRIFAQNKGYTYGLGVRRFIDTNDSTSPLGHFGWDGAAGFYLMIDPTNNLSYVYAQDVLNSGITFHLIHRQLRDLVYLCMRE